MAARGTIAKQKITEKIAEFFGQDYVGEFDKKLYIWADDGGEKVQIALSMTCPKAPVGAPQTAIATKNGGMDFDVPAIEIPTVSASAQLTDEELDNVRELMRKLNL